jgi:hypothetical protein
MVSLVDTPTVGSEPSIADMGPIGVVPNEDDIDGLGNPSGDEKLPKIEGAIARMAP